MDQPNIQTSDVTQCFVAIGSNSPPTGQDCQEIVNKAFSELQNEDVDLVEKSKLYHSPCFPAGAGPDYVNAVVSISTRLCAQKTLTRLHDIEKDFGRIRQQRWGARVLDLDLLAFGQSVLPDLCTFDAWRMLPLDRQSTEMPPELILPHPRLQDRAFVLVPMAEIAPDWCHPVLKKTAAQMRDALPLKALAEVVPL